MNAMEISTFSGIFPTIVGFFFPQIAEKYFHFKDIPEVPLAACLKVFGPYDRQYQFYLDLFAYLEKGGYSIVGAPRACYVDGIWNQEEADKSLTIIQVPVETSGD